MFLICYIYETHSCPEDRCSAWVNMKHSEVPEIPSESFPGASGRKLNSRSRRRASVFATAVVTLHPSFLSTHPLLTYVYSVKYDDWLKSEEPDLFCLCVIRHRPCSQLSCNSMGIAARAFRTSRSVGCRLYLHRSRRTWRERRDCMVVQQRCRWRASSSLLTNWLTIFQPFDPLALTFMYQ